MFITMPQTTELRTMGSSQDHDSMGSSNEVRIAVLELEVRSIKASMRDVNSKLDSIMDTLAQMSGGKRAIFALFAIIGGFIGAGAAVLSAALTMWPRHP